MPRATSPTAEPYGRSQVPAPTDQQLPGCQLSGKELPGSQVLVPEPSSKELCGSQVPKPSGKELHGSQAPEPNAKVSDELPNPTDDEGSDDDAYAPWHQPPPLPSPEAIAARVRRLTKPRADGSYPLPPMFMEQWKDVKQGRPQVLHLFEKCNYEID